MREEEYIGIIGEIFDGYTEFDYFGKPAYLKHISIRDQRYTHRFYDKYKTIAIDKGIPCEKDILKQLRDDGLWSDEDDLKIAGLEAEIESLKNTQRNLNLPSQKESFQKDIDEKSLELFRLRTSRKEVVGKTAEDYASSRTNEEFIRYVIYKDPELTEHYFTDEEFADLEDQQITLLLKQYDACSKRLNEQVIQESVLRDFFNMYMSQMEDVAAFYGKPIIHLTMYQLKLALYARAFFNILQHNPDIPDTIKKDPAAILRFSESKRNAGSGSSSPKSTKNSDGGATAVFGATKEDLDYVDPNARKISLADELKKHGGAMNMEQMMKMMG